MKISYVYIMKWIFALLMLVFVACSSEKGDVYMTDSKELDGKVLAVCSGNASYESDFKRMFPNAKIKYFTNYFDTFIAVTKGIADGAFAFIPLKNFAGKLPEFAKSRDGYGCAYCRCVCR